MRSNNPDPEAQEERATSVRSLDKAVTILKCLAQANQSLELTKLVELVNIPKSTLLRILRTLEKHGLVRQAVDTKWFCLGSELIALGRAAERNYDLTGEMRPFLMRIADRLGETASLTIRAGDQAVYIDQVLSHKMIRGNTQIGLALSLHCSSGGKVLLSSMNDDELEGFLKRNRLDAKTPNTIVDPNVLKQEIGKVREQGYAVDNEEVEVGGRCVAAPLRDAEGRVIAAVSIMGPSTRIQEHQLAEFAGVLKEEVSQASRKLGYNDGQEKIGVAYEF